MNATTRRAAPGDERTLAELNAFVQDFHVINNPAYFKPGAREEVTAWFKGLLEKSTVKIWIAEAGGVPVGYASAFLHERAENAFCRSRRWLEIDQIGVRPDWRRRGIGRGGSSRSSSVLQTRREYARSSCRHGSSTQARRRLSGDLASHQKSFGSAGPQWNSELGDRDAAQPAVAVGRARRSLRSLSRPPPSPSAFRSKSPWSRPWTS
ncbi:MAG: GNAT family N-acetyltransferase [bacterium]